MSELTLTFAEGRQRMALHCGADSLLAETEAVLQVKIVARDAWMELKGTASALEQTKKFFGLLEQARAQGMLIRPDDFRKILQAAASDDLGPWQKLVQEPLVLPLRKMSLVPRTFAQKHYLQTILHSDIVFGVGPAGTGKTYLAMAAAMHALSQGTVRRIILTRPAVEAGEALGFLPGDLREKILPYLIPLYDALYDMMGKDEVNRLIERNIIEVAPLAYMRGRTLSDSFVVLDEAQNATAEQMMMFLTRLGEKGKMVVTGDPTQVDLPRHRLSGLHEALEALRGVRGVELCYFEDTDVVRHALVERIVKAYARHRRAQGA